MDKKVKDLRRGLRLDIKKPPKVETPKSVYTRRKKHKEGRGYDEFRPSFFYFSFEPGFFSADIAPANN